VASDADLKMWPLKRNVEFIYFVGHWQISYSTLLEPGLSSLPLWVQLPREYAGIFKI
jgi:hypothetical protein